MSSKNNFFSLYDTSAIAASNIDDKNNLLAVMSIWHCES
jgi:hypothetical protein